MDEEKELLSDEMKMRAIFKEDLHQVVRQEVEGFKKFAFRSNMIQMAVAFMLGAAFNKLVTSLSENIVMPLINFSIGKTGVPWRELTFVPVAGLTMEVGKFLAASIDFLVLSMVLYILYIKIMKGTDLQDKKCQLQKKE